MFGADGMRTASDTGDTVVDKTSAGTVPGSSLSGRGECGRDNVLALGALLGRRQPAQVFLVALCLQPEPASCSRKGCTGRRESGRQRRENEQLSTCGDLLGLILPICRV